MGTMVEIVTYYLLREWGLCDYISIERGLPEYGNKEITHNVEFTLHPVLGLSRLGRNIEPPVSVLKMMRQLDAAVVTLFEQRKRNVLLDANNTLRNSCLLAENDDLLLVGNLHGDGIHVSLQRKSPFAMIECKRVGVEDGCKKGPQTIEKAKQGAYVAQTTSSLQKIWMNGQKYGLVCKNGSPLIKPYAQLLDEVSVDDVLLKDFVLSVGVVSNHGNWFTAENKNKEMKVLSNAYDWLLFLTDAELAEFVSTLLLHPNVQYQSVRDAFVSSYKEGKRSNVFTKTKIDRTAHEALCKYFHRNIKKIEGWFNVIEPEHKDIAALRTSLSDLAAKRWGMMV